MKKQIIYLSMTLLTLTACTTKKDIPLVDSGISTIAETNIKYDVEQTILSKGFQSIIPNVEVLEKGLNGTFLVNLGVVECSMASVDSISRVNNEINIFTSIKKEWGKTDIVVPQIKLKIKNIDDAEISDLKFNIIPVNYTPIDLKFDKTQVLNKIYTQLKYTNNTAPNVSLVKENDEFIWNIKLNNTFAKDNPSSPLYMVKAKISSVTGELIEAKPILLSQIIDSGKILDFADDKYIVYSQKEIIEKSETESIWLYDITDSNKQKVYSTHNHIYSTKLSPDLKKLAIIEHNGKLSDLYVVDLDKTVVQKITPMDYKHIWNINWKDNNTLYGINNDDKNKSSVILFNIENNNQEVISTVRLNVSSFDIYEDTFAFVDSDFDKDISHVYIKEKDKRLKKIDYGIDCKFADENSLLYIKKLEKEDKFQLYLYNLKENEEKLVLDLDVRKFIIIDKDNILAVTKNTSSTDYSLHLHNLKENKTTLLGQVLDKNIFYSSQLNTAFFSVVPASENPNSEFIYGVDFNKLTEYEKDS